jgi:DNA-binding NarL/FixJ family response regulator
MNESQKIRILIADDFKSLRDVIRLYLQRARDMEVVGEAPELDEAVARALALQPDVIILNDYLPPVDSALAAALFHEQGIPAAILSISMHVEPELIRRSLEHGVQGFLDKDEIDTCLVEAIQTIHRGERYFSPKARAAYGSSQE